MSTSVGPYKMCTSSMKYVLVKKVKYNQQISCRQNSITFSCVFTIKQELVQTCLRAPHMVADKAMLAIVFTYFFLLFLFSSFFFFFFSAFYFSPTSGNLPCVKICFPQYFGITRRYMQKK